MMTKIEWRFPVENGCDFVESPVVKTDLMCRLYFDSKTNFYFLEKGNILKCIEFKDKIKLYVSGKTGIIKYIIKNHDVPEYNKIVGNKVDGFFGVGKSFHFCLQDEHDAPLIDQTNLLIRKAWTRVTWRFHRDVCLLEQDIKKVLKNLENHKIWFPKDEKYEWLSNGFQECVIFNNAMVDPTHECISENDNENIAFRIWAECFTWRKDDDWQDNDSGGWINDALCIEAGAPDMPTLLKIINAKVNFFYNQDGSDKDVPIRCPYDSQNDKYTCEDDGTGFCKKCGYLINY